MNYADLLVLIVLGFLVIRGFLKGFVVSIIRTFSLFISLILAKMFHVQFAGFIFSTFPGTRTAIYDGVRNFVINSLPKGGAGGIDFSALLGGIAPEISASIPKDMDVSQGLDALIRSTPQLRSAVDTLTAHISSFVINCISFVILFAIVSIAIEIVIIMMKAFRKLPVIGAFDSILGAVLGLVQGWLILSVVFFVIVNVNHAGMMSDFALQIQNSMFARYLMSFSMVNQMVKGIMEITAWAF